MGFLFLFSLKILKIHLNFGLIELERLVDFFFRAILTCLAYRYSFKCIDFSSFFIELLGNIQILRILKQA